MKLEITKEKPKWSKVQKDKRVVMVRFPNCEFIWMPTYTQITEIMKNLNEIELESWN